MYILMEVNKYTRASESLIHFTFFGSINRRINTRVCVCSTERVESELIQSIVDTFSVGGGGWTKPLVSLSRIERSWEREVLNDEETKKSIRMGDKANDLK